MYDKIHHKKKKKIQKKIVSVLKTREEAQFLIKDE